jgi:DNA adenine methylase
VIHTQFVTASFEETMASAREGDVVYCDPPYAYSQQILYGSQSFDLEKLWQAISRCASIGAKVLLSLDGRKKSGSVELKFQLPDGLFRRQVFLDCGSSMLRRFQKSGETMEDEMVHDRLLLTW